MLNIVQDSAVLELTGTQAELVMAYLTSWMADPCFSLLPFHDTYKELSWPGLFGSVADVVKNPRPFPSAGAAEQRWRLPHVSKEPQEEQQRHQLH